MFGHTVCWVFSLAISAQSQKLNGPLPSGPGPGGGDVHGFQLSSEESHFAYTADQDTADVIELYVGRVDGSSVPWKVSGPLNEGGDVQRNTARFSPDGQWVVYLADGDTNDVWELYSAPADGSGPARRLNGTLVADGDVGDEYNTAPFRIADDSSRVVYLADEDVDERYELYSVPIDGSAASVSLCGSLPPNGDVERFSPGYAIAPGGARVAFVADRDLDEVLELYSVPIDGSTPPVKLNTPLGAEQDVNGENGPDFLFTPDGSRVIYRADQETDDIFCLYSVPADGSATPTAVATFIGSRDALDFGVTSDRVVFLADLAANDFFELFSSPLDFLSTPVRISGRIVIQGDVNSFAIEADEEHVTFLGDVLVNDHTELFRVSLLDSDPPVRLNSPLPPGRNVRGFRLERGGSHVAYLANPRGYDELFAVPLDGLHVPRLLSGPLIEPHQVQWDFQVAAGRVVFRSGAAGIFELFSAPVTGWPPMLSRAPGSSPMLLDRPRGPVRLHPTLNPGTSIAWDDFVLTSSGVALLRADLVTWHQSELFAVSDSAPPRKLNAALTPGPAWGDVSEFAWSGDRVVYSGTQRAEGFGELFTVAPDEAPDYEQIVELSTYGCVVQEFRLTPDGSRGVYVGSDATPGRYEIYSVLLDGSDSPVKLNAPITTPGGDVYEDFLLSPDGTKVVYRGNLGNDGSSELYSAPVNGSAAAQRLSPSLNDLQDVQPGMQISPDGDRVVYLADVLVDGRMELYSVPMDGSVPAVRLDATAIADGDVTSFRIAPDSSFVVYTADQTIDQRSELFRVPIDGAQPPLRLSMTLGNGGGVWQDFFVTPDSMRVTFVAVADFLAGSELYVVPSDGSQPAQLLHPQHLFGDGVRWVLMQPSGERMVYVEYDDVSNKAGLFSVPVDGSAPPLAIAPRLTGPYADIEEPLLAPDGSEVLYIVRAGPLEKELYQASAVASHAPFEIAELHDQTGYLFTPDGATVVVRTSTVNNGTVELFAAPADGSAGAVRVNDSLTPGGNVTEFAPGPTGTVLYRADQDEDNVFELYLAPLP